MNIFRNFIIMKTISFLLVFGVVQSLFNSQAIAQENLVPNPSFEQYTNCPDNYGELQNATGWQTSAGSPEYYNACDTSGLVSVPYNDFGYQDAADGSGYIGLYTFLKDSPNDREYVGRQLISPLVIGQKYYISMKVNLTLKPNYFCCASNKIGALFSTQQYQGSTPVNNFSHVYSDKIITDTIGWTLIKGVMVADSAYQYITLGNFFDDLNTDTLQFNDSAGVVFTYYYVDDVCVSVDSATCDFVTSIQPKKENRDINVFPNPAYDFLNIRFRSSSYSTILLYDVAGKCLLHETAENKKLYQVDISNYEPGIYLLILNAETQNISRKIIVK